MTPTRSVDDALRSLRRGGLVAIPTETVYGLAADASNPEAVQRIFDVKGRPTGHPLIVHLATAAALPEWAATVPDAAATLAEACWPGPLTVIVRRATRVIDAVTGGRDTVGLRVPDHPLTAELLGRFGGGLAAPSANRFGSVSPTTAQHVVADLGDRLIDGLDVILDGGPCPIGVESTIVDCTVEPSQILRAGGITPEDVHRILNHRVGPASGPSRASGMLASHYAPAARVLLAESAQQAAAIAEAEAGNGPVSVLDGTDDLVRYARDLYAWLRTADRRGDHTVVAVLPPRRGLGHAIRDRLTKAAHPRPAD